jgi:two-component system chemotaxis response regulator CheB
MGRDGCRGAEEIVHCGGSIIAQDAATSVVWGMPRAVVEARLTNTVLPIHSIAGEILKRCSP